MSGNKLLGWGLPLLVAAIPAAAFYTLGLRSFYINGAWWGDAGILASVMWHSSWALHLPLVAGGRSFLATHMALVFWLSSGLSWVLPFSRVQFFALFLGAVQGLMAVPVYVLLARLGLKPLVAAALAILFACNGIVLAASCNPHFELLIVASGMAFLAALACGQPWLARLCLLLCLMTREDAGFHLALLLLAGSAGLRWQGVDWTKLRPLLGYAGFALCWSLTDLAVQHIWFPSSEALQGVYLGHPLFSGLTPVVLATRLTFWILYRLYVILPLLAALVLAERYRTPLLWAGFASCLPWLGLNWFAASPYAGTLSDYYPFPLVFGLFWPLVGQIFAEQFKAPRLLSRRRAVAGFAIVLGASFIGLWGVQNPQALRFPFVFFNPPGLAVQAKTDRAITKLAHAALGKVAADGAVIALDPDHYTQPQLVWWSQPELPDTVIFFPAGQGTAHALALAKQAGLTQFYEIPGTQLRIATNRPAALASLRPRPWVPSQ